MWFLELILNILLLAGVTLVTFSSRAEQERGLAVPMIAAVSPATTRPAVEAPSASPAVPEAPTVPSASSSPAGEGNPQETFQQAWGALQLWAAGLDGSISADELKRIQDSVAEGWSGTQGARDYLKAVNERINAGQAEQVVQDALQVIGRQSIEVKTKVMKSVMDFMKSNGVTVEQTQAVLGRWVTQVLKLSPMDVVNFVKNLDKN